MQIESEFFFESCDEEGKVFAFVPNRFSGEMIKIAMGEPSIKNPNAESLSVIEVVLVHKGVNVFDKTVEVKETINFGDVPENALDDMDHPFWEELTARASYYTGQISRTLH